MEIRRPHPTVDFDEVLALVQACDRAVYGDSDWTESELREEWDGLELETDAWLAVDGGRIAGVMHLAEPEGGQFVADGYVHPELIGRGAGAALLEQVEQRARSLEPTVPAGERTYLQTSHLVGDARAPDLLASRGFSRVRSFFRMVIDLEQPHPSPNLPDGLELRPLDVARDGPRVHAALEEAFEHEWGHAPRPYDAWSERTFGWHRFDPTLVVVVWDGGEVAAASLNYDKRMGDWGWIGTLGVRPGWRRRGLGLAVLQESFRRFQARGEKVAALGVDAENPTGATRLYERVGMRVLWRADVWHKELRPGV